jgi:hypothetical protein
MSTALRVFFFVLPSLSISGFGQADSSAAFPEGAMVLESRALPPSAHSNRALVLWMEHPQKRPRFDEGFKPTPEMNVYSCPEETRGSFYSGPTRISLLDTMTNKIINTVQVKGSFDNGDVFDIPYMIHPKYYRVDPPLKTGEGKPIILDLKDYNGDGKALEFALFDAGSCTVLLIQLIGYSLRQDRVIQFPIQLLNWEEEGKITKGLWLDRVFLQKPTRPGLWEYMVPERFCDIPTYLVRYDPAQEGFVGNVKWKHCGH